VAFSQTVGLVQLLRAHHVDYELIVYPDDVHDPLLHKRWVYELTRTCEFLNRYLKASPTTTP
jgi:dipeptidyl aminopeptidase/acylaminoacyl peptidase